MCIYKVGIWQIKTLYKVETGFLSDSNKEKIFIY